MVITDNVIRKLATESNMITPFEEKKLQSESYDVTIGSQITIMKKEIRCLDISNQDELDGIYENINIDKGYVISPKQYILVTLKEKLNLPNNVTAHLRPKTSYTRLGLIVSHQHCNSTYHGTLKIGVFNATDYPIRIYSGYTIAQLVFEELSDIPSHEKQYKNKADSHYQDEVNDFRGAKFDNEYLDSLWKKMLS